jgi:hypothetical protein
MTRPADRAFRASAVQIDGEWWVQSPYWCVRMFGEREARRMAEIVDAACRSGRREMARDMRALLQEACDD